MPRDRNCNGPRLPGTSSLGRTYLLVCLIGCLLGPVCIEPSLAQPPETVPSAAAIAALKPNAEIITKRTQEMNLLYEGKGFGGDLEGHLSSAGADVSNPERHILRWAWEGGGRSYYNSHLQALNESIKVVQAQGYAVKADLDYLDRGMEAWKRNEENLRPVFADAFSQLVSTGALPDEPGKIDPAGISRKRFFDALKPDTDHSASGAKDGEW